MDMKNTFRRRRDKDGKYAPGSLARRVSPPEPPQLDTTPVKELEANLTQLVTELTKLDTALETLIDNAVRHSAIPSDELRTQRIAYLQDKIDSPPRNRFLGLPYYRSLKREQEWLEEGNEVDYTWTEIEDNRVRISILITDLNERIELDHIIVGSAEDTARSYVEAEGSWWASKTHETLDSNDYGFLQRTRRRHSS